MAQYGTDASLDEGRERKPLTSDSTMEAGKNLARDHQLRRAQCPVFVIGCHRSGTNLMYDMLMSAGGFALYRGYLPVYKMLIPKLGKFDNPETRKKLIALWIRSKGFRRSDLDAMEFGAQVERECRSGGDFIRITMEAITRKQNAQRWAVYDPDNILFMPQIKAEIPGALFIHMVRDGRDIALSLSKMEGFQPLPWDRGDRSLMATALYWEWMVRKGRMHARQMPADYMEVHYEDLVSNPKLVLAGIGEFLDHDLDYQRIQAAGLGRLSQSNSSFREEEVAASKPLNRWKERLSRRQVAELEGVAGHCLQELGYELSSSEDERARSGRAKWMKFNYTAFLNTKLWLKTGTPLGRFANLSAMELQDEAPEEVTE